MLEFVFVFLKVFLFLFLFVVWVLVSVFLLESVQYPDCRIGFELVYEAVCGRVIRVSIVVVCGVVFRVDFVSVCVLARVSQ